MSTAEGGEGGGRVRKKRSTDGGDRETGPRRRCRSAAASTADDNAEGGSNGRGCLRKNRSGNGDGEIGAGKRCRFGEEDYDDGETGDDGTGDDGYSINGDENDGGGGDCPGDGEDSIYYYSDDGAETEVFGDKAIEPAEQRYVVLSQDGIRARQEADIAEVADVLSVPPGFAALLLRHYKWRAMRVQEEWFSDDYRRICDTVGLPADDGGVLVPMALSRKRLVCAICFRRFTAGRTRSAACSTHFYCDECWRGYISAAVEDGPRCLSLRCPDPSCSAAVAQELVDEVAADSEDKAHYAQFALWSFVDDSGGRVKWCPGRGCGRAVEFVGCAGDATDVFCECTHGFCWSCGEEAHRPVSCDTVRAWLDKNANDSETANWVLTHTKHCPGCRKPIEKNHGCNNMRCRCGHYFCWICLDPLNSRHTGCDGYGRLLPGKVNAGVKNQRRRQENAKASLDRYLYHYERWAANHRSLQVVFTDMADLERSGLEKMADKVRVPVTELTFLTKAYEQVAECRRVLRWAHAYGYFLDPKRDAIKRNLFDQLQKDANRSLERLHGCAEGERMELCAGDDAAADIAERYQSYKKKLQSLTQVTRHYFENLVKAFETNLAEVDTAE